MKEDQKRKTFGSLRHGGWSRFGFKDVDIEIVKGDDARGDTRWKTWEWLRMMGKHGGFSTNTIQSKYKWEDATSWLGVISENPVSSSMRKKKRKSKERKERELKKEEGEKKNEEPDSENAENERRHKKIRFRMIWDN